MIYFLIMAVGTAVVKYYDLPIVLSTLTFLWLICAIIRFRKNINILTICIGLLFIHSVETLAFRFIPTEIPIEKPAIWYAFAIYGTHLLVDIANTLFIIYRPHMLKLLIKNQVEKIHTISVDLALVNVFVLFICVDLLAIIENFIRNLEHLGVSETYAKQYWDWILIYKYYPDLKYILSGLLFVTLWFIASRERNSEGNVSL